MRRADELGVCAWSAWAALEHVAQSSRLVVDVGAGLTHPADGTRLGVLVAKVPRGAGAVPGLHRRRADDSAVCDADSAPVVAAGELVDGWQREREANA